MVKKWKETKKKMDKTLEQLDHLAAQFTAAAQDGLTPEYIINTTRNLYRDQTHPLAEKRAKFIQKYLFMRLQENLGIKETKNKDKVEFDLKNAPEWVTDFQSFTEVVKAQHPKYEGISSSEQPGSYGPNPKASVDEQPAEIEKLKKNLETRVKEYQDQKKEYEEEESNLIKEIGRASKYRSKSSGLIKEIQMQESLVKKLQDKIEQEEITDLDQASALEKQYKEELTKLAVLKKTKVMKEQKLQEAKQMKQHLKEKISKFDVDKKVKDLQDFYANRPAGFANGGSDYWSYKRDWDKKLFNDFKMAQVEGKFIGETTNDEEITVDDINPKITYLLEKNFTMRGFQCQYKIDEIRRSRKKWSGGNRNWPRLFWNIPALTVAYTVATPFIAVGWFFKKIGNLFKKKSTCPVFDGRGKGPYRKIKDALSIRKKGRKGRWHTVNKDPIKYEGPDNVWPEVQELMRKRSL